MTFLVSSRHDGSILAGMNTDRLLEIRNAIQEGLNTGLIHESYAFVDGGSVWILEAENEAVVWRLLRSIGVKNAEVTAIVRTLDLIDAHLEHRMNASAAALDRITA
jgi:hypothetical protein